MELKVFVPVMAKPGRADGVERALTTVVEATRGEAGCLGINAFRSVRDQRLFYVQSTWADEAAFDLHALLPHTVAFIDEVTSLLEHPVEPVRCRLIV